MIRITGILAAFTGSAASAQVATISECRLEPSFDETAVYCQIENLSETAIARVQFYIEIIEDGRSVPWATQGGGSSQRSTSIPGGIESNEIRETFISVISIPSEADLEKTRAAVTATSFRDVNDQPITTSPN